MIIQQLETTTLERESRIADLRLLLEQPTSKEMRPCRFCTMICETCGSVKCTCNCTSECEEAARQLSSEPDQYPIEHLILPLVFHLNALRVIQPCWSCEGHLDSFSAEEKIWKLPQVWFYSRSVVYPQLVNDYLRDLKHHSRLNHHWQVNLCYADDPYGTCFGIIPDLCREEQVQLSSLQKDIKEISASLENNVRANALYLLEKMKSSNDENSLKVI